MKTRSRYKLITLTNDFHNTEVILRCKQVFNAMKREYVPVWELSEYQVHRARKMLCGVRDCGCSNEAGMRGKDNPLAEFYPDGTGAVWYENYEEDDRED